MRSSDVSDVLRMTEDSVPRVALKWKTAGKRKPGRPKMTWKCTISSDFEKVKQRANKNQVRW